MTVFRFVVVLVLVLGCQRGFALDDLDTAHLLGRTGFGLASSTWSDYKNLGRGEAVDYLFSRQSNTSTAPSSEFVDSDVYQLLSSGKLSKSERRVIKETHVKRHRRELAAWWWTEMLATQTTLNERMVLFWHGHFTSDVRKTQTPFIYEQNQVFREHGLGDYRVLLREIIKGPAMQLFLDNTKNRKTKPNENLARELLELFTLGVGNYSEDDVREIARALTGWQVSEDRKTMVFRPKHHDAEEKTILGRTGHWGLQDVLDIILDSPSTSEFIVAKLWREFVSPEPDKAEVLRLSELFRESNYSIEALLRALLISDAFWAEQNRYVLVKSPVELTVGAIRDYSISVEKLEPIISKVKACGQQLFYPPDVKGWRGHSAWLSTGTIVQRQVLLEYLLRLKRREYSQNSKKMDLSVVNIIRNDSSYFDIVMQNATENNSRNEMGELKKILLNDLYQFK